MRLIHLILIVLALAAPAFALDTLTQYGLSWRFVKSDGTPASLTTDTSGDYQYGIYLTGDFWIRNIAGGSVWVDSITPASTSGGVEKNGSMINPVPGPSQGYDEEILYTTYSSALNVALDVGPGNLLEIPAGSSLVSTASAVGSDYLQVDTQAILTVVSTAPAADSFRPPYCGTNKASEHTKADLDYTVLRTLPRAPSTPSMTTPYGMYTDEAFDSPANWFARPWVDHGSETGGNHMHPVKNMPFYGRELARYTSWAALLLNFDFSDAQKESLLIGYMQYAIDLEGVIAAGGGDLWKGNGTITSGRKLPLVVGSMVLSDAGMTAILAKSGDYQDTGSFGNPPADYVNFLEDDQTHYVTQDDVDATHSVDWNPDDRAADLVPYDANDIGLAEWGIRHAEDPLQNNKHWSAVYRTSSSAVTAAAALAARIMTGAETIWNRPAMFDYADRYVTYIWSAAFESWAQTTYPTDYLARIDAWRFGPNGFESVEDDPFVKETWDLYWDDPSQPAGPTQVYKYVTTAGTGSHTGDDWANSYSLSEVTAWYSGVADQDANNIDVTLTLDGVWDQGAVTTEFSGTRNSTHLTLYFVGGASITASTTVLRATGGNVLIDGARLTMEPAAYGDVVKLSLPTAGAVNIVRNSVIRVNNSALKNTTGIDSGVDLSGSLIVENCEITYGPAVASNAGIFCYADTVKIVNTTLHGWKWGVTGYGDWTAINSVSGGTSDGDWYTDGTLALYACASEDGTASTYAADGNCHTGTINFSDVANRDYTLAASDANLIDGGIDPTTQYAAWDQDYDVAGLIRVWDGDSDGTAVIDIGAYEYGSEVEDATPDAFDLGASVVAAETSTVYTAGPITLAGFNVSVPIDVTGDGATYNIDGGSYTTAPGMVEVGAVIRVQVTSADAEETERIATLTVGGVSDTYSVTTASLPDTTPPTPDPPTGLAATPASESQIDLSWPAGTDDTGPITTRVQIATVSDFSTILNTASTTGTSYSFATADAVTTYYFRIRYEDAADPANVTSYSSGVSATTYYPPPGGTARRMHLRYEQ